MQRSINDIRTAYLRFFEARGHAVLPSAPIVPENDPTTLFTGSGMQPLLPYLLGSPHPKGTRLVNSQKCFRAEDIEEVGDNRHTTFFEMLGNWSLGDYFKQEQLSWIFTFLTEELGLDPQRLYVTVFAGDERYALPRDDESVALWKALFSSKGIAAEAAFMGTEEEGGQRGMREGERIFYYRAEKNWWSRAGVPEHMPAGEPGGPDSEIFFDFRTPHDPAFGPHCHPNCDCGRFMEIGNSVFMEYVKEPSDSFAPLPKKNVDFGGGLERIAAALADDPDVFRTSAFAAAIAHMEQLSGTAYTGEHCTSFRIVADHLRGATFILSDGVTPANTEAGYVLRRIIRRAVRHADLLGLPPHTLSGIAEVFVEQFGEAYPELTKAQARIRGELEEEERRFRATLARGLREFEKRTRGKQLSGEDAFILFTTYGFPLEMTEELAREKGIAVDRAAFARALKEHQAQSRAAAQGKFRGGLGDTSTMSVRYHTATHLLHEALRRVLGEHVAQKGSNITPARLRFDFSHPKKLTEEEIAAVERLVNEKIREGLPVHYADLPKEEALALGARHEFLDKYGDVVRVYFIGPRENFFSAEFCGGPHVANTAELAGRFRIVKEEACAAGVRRIKAILEEAE